MTGRLIGAEEAERIGLVNRVAPPEELDAAVEALVDELLACAPWPSGSPSACWTPPPGPALSTTLELEVLAQERCARTADFAEGARAVPPRSAPPEFTRPVSGARRRARRRDRRRQARARDAGRRRRGPRRDRQHGRRRGDPRRLRLARPRPRHVLARRPHRRARLGPARRHVRGHGRAARARRGRVVRPRRPRPGGLPAAGAAAGRGRDARPRRSTSCGARSACRRACCRWPTRPCARGCRARGAWHALPGVHDPRARGRAGGGRRVPRRRGGVAPARGRWRRSPAARAVIVGPSNPVISIGPILAVPGMREALRATPAPVVAVSPLVGGRVLKGPDRRVPGLGRRAAVAPTASRRTTTGCSTGSWPTSGRTRCRCSRPTSPCPTPPGAGAWPAAALGFAVALGRTG